ncbi:MAG: DUF58 domain-containing protein [Algisphaera sp.]
MTSLLNPADLAPLQNLVFSPRRSVSGHYAGKHASPQRGSAVEFRDYRAYTPGDAPSAIDWKVFGRSDRMVVRQFDHQTDLNVHLVVDASASMAYDGIDSGASNPRPASRLKRWLGDNAPAPQVSKWAHASRAASALAYLVIQQQDKAGLAVSRDGLHQSIAPASTWPHLHHLAKTLSNIKPQGHASLADTLHALGQRTRRRGVFVVFSDLADSPDPLLKAIDQLHHAGHEVLVFHTLHADELELPDLSETLFVDSETGETLHVQVDDVRADYAKQMQRRINTWRRSLTQRGADHTLLSTATPVAQALRQYLFQRSRN